MGLINLKSIPTTIGIGLIIGLGGGWKAHSIKTKADYADALETAQAASNEAIKAAQLKLEERESENSMLATRLDEAKANVRTEIRTITREVPKYVPQNTLDCSCDLSPDFVRMFNNAATRGQDNPDSTPITPLDLSGKLPKDPNNLAGGR